MAQNPALEQPPPDFMSNSGVVGSAAMSALTATPNATQFDETPTNQYFASNPTIMANAWQLPVNAGSLRLSAGGPTGTPASPQSRASIAQAVQMLDLYGKFENGQPLSSADVEAASQLGGNIARAAQLLGKAKQIPAQPGKPGKSGKPGIVYQPVTEGGVTVGETATEGTVGGTPDKQPTKARTQFAKGTEKALAEASHEISTRLETLVGINPDELNKKGLAAPVPKQFASVMQNAGYGVTQAMSLSQALDAASGKGPQGIPQPDAATNLTVGQYLQSMSKMSKPQIYQLQQQLFHGGYYDATYTDGTKSYTQGVLDIGTVEAMRKAILTTLDQNSSGNNVTLEQVINNPNQFAATLGSQGALAGASKTATVPMATDTQTQQPLINAFVAALGRNPTQAELQAFTNQYNTELQDSSKTLTEAGENPQGIVDYQTGIPFVQGTPTVSAAASQYAENVNPTEYQAHNIANGFGLLMNLIDRQGVSALDTPGTRPTATT